MQTTMSAAPDYIAIGVVVLVILAAACDITSRRIPNLLVLTGWLVALALQCRLHGISAGLAQWVGGWLTGLAILLPFYLVRGMAAGDVKLMMAVGAWVGMSQVAVVALVTFVLGGIWALGATLARGRMRQLISNISAIWGRVASQATGRTAIVTAENSIESVGTLPYGVAIALGTIGVLFANA